VVRASKLNRVAVDYSCDAGKRLCGCWSDRRSVPAAMVEPAAAAETPPGRVMLAQCQANFARLNSKERGLLSTLERWRGTPTIKQLT
jgi:hypothetical protein